ncbi:MAG: CHAD domain-containing protein [Kiritimatiellae bacterium]|nr:CHAD domain-containing protein [Kiritimatiellia bacterium]MDW8459405.1 CHAD domain-containing protein [Verrucomicrobiota bacterium]
MPSRPANREQTPGIEELCAEFQNENPHTEFVASLALEIFDAVRSALNLRKSDRLLLEAASKLHDIAYSQDPANHPQAAAELILSRGLRGFTARQQTEIAAIISLHGKLPDDGQLPRALGNLAQPERIFKLAAILRIADALDSGHLQESRIKSISLDNGLFRIQVATPAGAAGIERAMAKSDLWQRVFPLGVLFEAVPRKCKPEPQPDQPAGEALRRLMLRQFRVLRTSARRAAREDDEETLHDLRIAARSLRRILEAFDRPLRDTSAKEVESLLRDFTKALGPARDIDVWLAILQKPKIRPLIESAPDFLAAQEKLRAGSRADLRAYLQGPDVQNLMARFGYLLRIELVHAGGRLNRKFGPLARRAVRDAWRAALAKKRWAKSQSPEKLHRLRIRLRKLRLLTSLVEAALGSRASFLIETVRPIERNLGRIHDLDLALARASEAEAPPELVAALAKRRRKEYKRFREAWDAFLDRKIQRNCRAAWK